MWMKSMIQGPMGGDRVRKLRALWAHRSSCMLCSAEQQGRAAKGTETWQREGAKSKLLVIQDTLGNKKPGILSPVLNEMKKGLNNWGLSSKQPKHSSPASFLGVLQTRLHLCVQGPCTASKSPPEMLPIKSGTGISKMVLLLWPWVSLFAWQRPWLSLFLLWQKKNPKKPFCGEYMALLLCTIA